MAIIQAGYENLGYAKLAVDYAVAKEIAATFAAREFVHIIDDGNTVWVRDLAMEVGRSMPKLTFFRGELASGGEATEERIGQLIRTDRAYDEAQARNLPRGSLFDPNELVRENAAPARIADAILRSLWHATKEDTLRTLHATALPAFFKWCPAGRVRFYSVDYRFEQRWGLIRGGYARRLFSLAEMKSSAGGFDTMRHWHSVSGIESPRLLISLTSGLFYPYVHAFAGGPLGTLCVFSGAPLDTRPAERAIRDWSDVDGVRWDFGRVAAGPWRDPRLAAPSSLSGDEVSSLIDWVLGQYNLFAFRATNAAEFVADDGTSDFQYAFECNLTLDRLMRNGLACVGADRVATRTLMGFEAADLLEELRSRFDANATGTAFFKQIFNPVAGRALLHQAYAGCPVPHVARLIDLAYDALRKDVLDSVWVRARLRTGAVAVKNAKLTAEVNEPEDTFVPNVVRAVRNAHHGYMNENDGKQQRPSRYLSLTDGRILPAVGLLGALWALAAVVAPEVILAWPAKALGTYPASG